LRRRREFITHTDELHIHFGVLLHVLQQVHVEGLSLEEAKESSPSSLHQEEAKESSPPSLHHMS